MISHPISCRGLILLDRDGTLNPMVVDPEHGTIDSPLHLSQVSILPGIPEALAKLQSLGFGLAIVTNQPAAAKGKTTLKNLESVHSEIVRQVQSEGAKILSSHICFHRAEDHCFCRKPKTGLLSAAFTENPRFLQNTSWIIGDGIVDLQAGQRFGIQTAFIGSKKWDAQKIFDEKGLKPHLWVENFQEFAEILSSAQHQPSLA